MYYPFRYGKETLLLGIDPTIVSTQFAHGAGSEAHDNESLFYNWAEGLRPDLVRASRAGWKHGRPLMLEVLLAAWAQAGNITRWKAGRRESEIEFVNVPNSEIAYE
jgi:hypothetical protein